MTRPFVTSLESAYLGQANAVRQEEYILGCVLQKGEVTRSSRRNGTLGATVLAGGCYGAAAPPQWHPRAPLGNTAARAGCERHELSWHRQALPVFEPRLHRPSFLILKRRCCRVWG